MTEIINPARLIQSPALIGSAAVIFEKGREMFTLFLGDTTCGAERAFGAKAERLPSAISQPPISQADGAATCGYTPLGYHLPVGTGTHSKVRLPKVGFTGQRTAGAARPHHAMQGGLLVSVGDRAACGNRCP